MGPNARFLGSYLNHAEHVGEHGLPIFADFGGVFGSGAEQTEKLVGGSVGQQLQIVGGVFVVRGRVH